MPVHDVEGGDVDGDLFSGGNPLALLPRQNVQRVGMIKRIIIIVKPQPLKGGRSRQIQLNPHAGLLGLM